MKEFIDRGVPAGVKVEYVRGQAPQFRLIDDGGSVMDVVPVGKWSADQIHDFLSQHMATED